MKFKHHSFTLKRYILLSLCLILSLAKGGVSSTKVNALELENDKREERQQPTTFISTLKSSATKGAVKDIGLIELGNIHFEMPIPITKAAFEEGKQEYFSILKGNMHYLLADRPYIEDPAKEKLIANWAIKLGFLPDTLQSIEKISRLKTMSFFSTIANNPDDQLTLAKSLLLICLLDDTCDEMTEALKHTNVRGALDAFIAIFKGYYEYKPSFHSTNFPFYKSFVAAIVDIRSSLLSGKLDLAFYERSVEKWITALRWEYENRASINITETSYKKHRKTAVGADIIFEVACLLQGFTPSQGTRKNLIVKSLREVALYKVFLVNDVFSLPVELYNPSLNIIKMNINNENINFKLNKFINRYNKKVIEFCALEKQAPELEDAKRYIKMMRGALNGYINWKFNTAKYRYPPRKIREETTKVIYPDLRANL